MDEIIATSTDIETQVDCILIGHNWKIVAANRHTFGIEITEENSKRPVKYDYIEHAERNAIFRAARLGHRTLGATMIMKKFPCVECARAIVQSGIGTLCHGSTKGFSEERYRFEKSREILNAGDVVLIESES
ncbi:MAG: hypothetical protein COA84_13515 [Robiginitomaculum sp.]|nr:MAG: hypothetical protein COA84_13515 [Robiginitomaculum sp.]